MLNKAPASGQTNPPALAQAKAAGELARRKIYAGIPDDDVALALAICQKYGFDPLLKHLVLIAGNIKDDSTGQWTKRYNAYVTRDGLLHVAHTSGMLDGLEVNLGKDDLGEWAEAAVYRKDMGRPFRYRVYLSEYAKDPRGAWKTHSRAMLTKTAEVFALRRAFDVALTPVEEMGFEETGSSIPTTEVSLEASSVSESPSTTANQKTSGLQWLDNEPTAGGYITNNEGVINHPIPAQSQEQTVTKRPRDHSKEQAPGTLLNGSKNSVVTSNSIGCPSEGQRRRLI